MARAGSTTSTKTARAPRKTAAQKAAEAAEAANQAVESTDENPTVETNTEIIEPVADESGVEIENENDGDIPGTESNNEVEETNKMTDTVETVADEAPASDTTEATEATETAATTAPVEIDLTDFEAAVATALAEKDASTGDLPAVQVEAVKAQYRELSGAKAKGAAKKHLTDSLRDRISSMDIQGGQAVMFLLDTVSNLTGTTKAPAERKAADPSAAFADALTVLHLAYTLRRADVPEGVTVDGEDGVFAKVDRRVEELADQADKYYAWVADKSEDKGDEPEVDPIVKKAVKASQGKAASATRASTTGSTRANSDGVRRSVRKHIAEVFENVESGTFLKVAEIANTNTSEYPEGVTCSSGAVNQALKSDKGIDGVEFVADASPAGARKI